MNLRHVLVCDPDSWLRPRLGQFAAWLRARGDGVAIVDDPDHADGDLAFLIGFGRIVPERSLKRYRHALVVHESDLPRGAGWSPLTWQILEGRHEIPIVLFEAAERVDSGRIYCRDVLRFTGGELIDELRDAQAAATFALCSRFVEGFPGIVAAGVEPSGERTRYRRRTPADSRLDPDRSIREQFAVLRVVDNDRYPAFFELEGERYVLRIERDRRAEVR